MAVVADTLEMVSFSSSSSIPVAPRGAKASVKRFISLVS
jgi:hypothetical protein